MSWRTNTFIISYAHNGEVADQTIYMHKYKNTVILNGVRSLAFTKINKPIPTTMFVKGNLVKLRHNGQDRTPFCTKCKTKGHYRLDCPELNNLVWTELAMDWAQEVEATEKKIHPQGGEQQVTVKSAHPLGGEQQATVEPTHPQGEQQQQQNANKKTETTTSPGGKQQKQRNIKTAPKKC